MKWFLRFTFASWFVCFAIYDLSSAQLFRDRLRPSGGDGASGRNSANGTNGMRPAAPPQNPPSAPGSSFGRLQTPPATRQAAPTARAQTPQNPTFRQNIPSLPSSGLNLPANRATLGNAARTNTPSSNINRSAITRPQQPVVPASGLSLPANRSTLSGANLPNLNPLTINRNPPARSQQPVVPASGLNLPANRSTLNNAIRPNQSASTANRPSLNTPNINLPKITRPNPNPPNFKQPSITLPSQPSTLPSNLAKRSTPLPSAPAVGVGSPTNQLPTPFGNGVASNRPSLGLRPGAGSQRPKPEIPLPIDPSTAGVSTNPIPESIPKENIARPTPLPDPSGLAKRTNRSGLNRPGSSRPSIGGVSAIATVTGNTNLHRGNGYGDFRSPYYSNVSIYLNRPFWDSPSWNNSWTHHNHADWNKGWQHHCVHRHYTVWYNSCWTGYWDSSWYSPVYWGGRGWGLSGFTNAQYNVVYANPYYLDWSSSHPSYALFDYSKPIVINNYSDPLVTSDTVDASTASFDRSVELAMQNFDAGLEAFKAGNYALAVNAMEYAIQKNGGDPIVHEVCALALFAEGDYQRAAAILNAYLASAPGMDWTSMSALYGNPDDYTKHLRALEATCRAEPKNPSAAFVLAYHYLVLGERESAIRALRIVVANQPNDVTAKRMLDALSSADLSTADLNSAERSPSDFGPDDLDPAQTDSELLPSPNPEGPNRDLTDVPPTTDLVGEWTAVAGDAEIELVIDESSQFRWIAREKGKPDLLLEGDLTTSENEIVLETKSKGSLAGSVQPTNNDEWTFFPPGTQSDQGLTFRRK